MRFKLFGRENEFSFGNRLGTVGFIKRIDGQCSFDADRLVGLFAVEHDSAAETANALSTRLIQYRMRPKRCHPSRLFDDGICHPGDALAQIELVAPVKHCATACEPQAHNAD